jgi:hypothetical protein
LMSFACGAVRQLQNTDTYFSPNKTATEEIYADSVSRQQFKPHSPCI